MRGRRGVGISRSLIWSNTLMELIFNPCGEFRWSPEDPVSQIHSPHLQVGAPGIFSDLLRSVQALKREGGEAAISIQSMVKLQPWFLSLQWKTCLQQNCSLGSCIALKDLPLGRTHNDDYACVNSRCTVKLAHVFGCWSRLLPGHVSGRQFWTYLVGTVRPGAHQSSEAAFCESAFAKSKLTFGKSAFARSRFAFRQRIFASQKVLVWPSATSKMLSAKTCQNMLEIIFAFC